LVDAFGHFVQKRTPNGEILLTLGTRGRAGALPLGQYFNMPTDAVVHEPTGDVFVADGYKNSFIHRFSSEGDHLLTWGALGSESGQLFLPHGLTVTEDRVIVCDRENFRLQVFTLDGEFVAQWHAFRPSAIRSSPLHHYLYLAELGPRDWNFLGSRDLGCRVKVL